MMLPSKIATFDECILPKTTLILKLISIEQYSVSELYLYLRDNFEDVNEFLLALDVLYILSRIKYNDENKVIEYVKENCM